MEKLVVFILRYCGYCRKAREYMDDALARNPAYAQLEIEYVDESIERDRARRHDYYYVPTFYIGSTKVHEGPVSARQVDDILRRAYETPPANDSTDKREPADAD